MEYSAWTSEILGRVISFSVVVESSLTPFYPIPKKTKEKKHNMCLNTFRVFTYV